MATRLLAVTLLASVAAADTVPVNEWVSFPDQTITSTANPDAPLIGKQVPANVTSLTIAQEVLSTETEDFPPVCLTICKGHPQYPVTKQDDTYTYTGITGELPGQFYQADSTELGWTLDKLTEAVLVESTLTFKSWGKFNEESCPVPESNLTTWTRCSPSSSSSSSISPSTVLMAVAVLCCALVL